MTTRALETLPATPERLRSHLLAAYQDRLRYGFTYRPLPTGGIQLDEADRQRHRRIWMDHYGLTASQLVSVAQCHGDGIFQASDWDGVSPSADAIALDKVGLAGLVQVADCVPVLLYAPDIHQAGLVHAGWRGTAQRITAQMAEHLIHQGASAKQLIAVIGPAISPQGFETGPEVLEALQATLPETHPESPYYHWGESGKPHLNLPLINQLQLEQMGITLIERLPMATDQDAQWLWSHRRGDWQRQGLMAQLL